MDKVISLVSSDNKVFEIDKKSAKRSELLNGIITDYEFSDIPIPDVEGSILAIIIKYLIHYRDTDPSEIPIPLPPNLSDIINKFELELIESLDLETSIEVINAANYMSIKSLFDLFCAKIANLIKGHTFEVIKDIFDIECGLTDDDIKQYEKYQFDNL